MSSGDLAVQCAKLPEWLLARRLIPEDYARLLTGVEAKVQEALAEPVTDERAKALIARHKESVTYFAARDIYEALSKTKEGQAKTLLGTHTHSATAKWKAVLDAFRRRNLGWASEARTLIQNATYDIPALKKHAAACERQVAECTQRQAELTRIETNAKGRYEALLKELGIDGFDPRRELVAQASAELPTIHAELAELLKQNGLAIADYYAEYARHAAGVAQTVVPLLRVVGAEGEALSVEEVEKQIPALKSLREARPASTVTTAGVAGADVGGASAGAGIDWGASGGEGGVSGAGEAAAESGAGGAGGIVWDFGGALGEAAGGDAGGINWGIEVASGEAEPQQAATGEGVTSAELDWSSFSLEGLEVRDQGDDALAGTGVTGASASSTLLDDPAARELLHQEVAEVAAFLLERCTELGPGGASSQVDSGPANMEKSLQDVQGMARVVAQAEELLAGRRTQRLVLLRSSARYLEQAVKRLEVAKAQCGKPGAQRSALDKAKAEQTEEAKRTRAEIEELRAATRRAQQDLEAELSAHFKSSVRIVGDVGQA